MPAPRLLLAQGAALIALVTVHRIALHYFLYWRIFWFDNVAHLLGGISVGLFVAWVSTTRGFPIYIPLCTLGAFAIGVEWEIFGYVERFPISPFMSYPLDTAKDLLMDAMGGALAAILARRLI